MKSRSAASFRILFVLVALLAFPNFSWPHVTLRPGQPLRLGGYGDVVMNVPSERASDTVSVTLEVPEAFLKAGGRLIGVEFPPGWQVVIDKEDKPEEVYSEEMAERAKRVHPSESDTSSAKSASSSSEDEELSEMRKKWIKKVTFKGGSIPPDGFKQFFLSLQLPKTPGTFRFPAVQLYADGTEVAWTELVEGAQHPAPSIVLENRQQQGNTPTASLVLSGLAFAIAALLALDRLRGKRPNVGGVASQHTEAI